MMLDMPAGCNVESICLPGHSEPCSELKKGQNKIGKRLNILLDHNHLLNELYNLLGDDLRQADGVQGDTMTTWRQRLQGRAVRCPLDKRKQEVVIMCPHFWYTEFVDWLQKQDVITVMPGENGEINEDFNVKLRKTLKKLKESVAYSGAVSNNTHQFGSARFYPKMNGFTAKADWSIIDMISKQIRPIGDYSRHGVRKVLGAVCNAILFMPDMIIMTKFSMCSAISVQHKFRVFNKKIVDKSWFWMPYLYSERLTLTISLTRSSIE